VRYISKGEKRRTENTRVIKHPKEAFEINLEGVFEDQGIAIGSAFTARVGEFETILEVHRLACEEIVMNTKQNIFNLSIHINNQHDVRSLASYAEDDVRFCEIVLTMTTNDARANWARAHC
jgi:hypothetical protein